jgi:CubicO group peptidase (beta-lactamase class C family)
MGSVITTAQVSVLDRALEQLIARRGIRHAIVAVESGDRALTWMRAAGQAAPDGPPMRPDTPFHYASVTKLYTATAVMQLWDFPPQDPSAAPQRARYSDTNFQLLGAIVAAVTARPFHAAVVAQILEPLGLDGTWFAGHPRGDSVRTPAVMWSDDDVLDVPQAMASIAPRAG